MVWGLKISTTTIKIHSDTKFQVDGFREFKNKSYDEVIKKVVYIENFEKCTNRDFLTFSKAVSLMESPCDLTRTSKKRHFSKFSIAKSSKNNPALSKEVIEAIEAARARIKKGNFMTEEEVRKRLGV